MDINIVEVYKQSNSKIEVIEKLARDTGKTIPEIFVELSEAKCCDGRFFRQGRYAKEWNEAKKIMKENNLKRAAEATTSFSNLKAENERLRKQIEELKSSEPLKVSVSEEEFEKLKEELEKYQQNSQIVAIDSEVPDSYKKTIDAQKQEIDKLNAAIEERDKSYQEAVQQMQEENNASDKVIEQLRSEIEQLKTANASAHDAFAKLDDEKSDSDALIEDLNNMIILRESQIEELNRKIEHLKVSDFNATTDSMVLESKLKTEEEKNAKLMERIRGLEEENEELRCTNCADDIKRQLAETTQNYNEAMLITRKLEEQIKFLEDEKEGDGLIIVDQAKKTAELERKLAKAERFVLNHFLYEVQQ